MFWYDQSPQEMHRTIRSGFSILSCDGTVYATYVIQEVLLDFCLFYDKVSSTYLFQSLGGFYAVVSAFSLKNFMYKLVTIGLTGDSMAVFSPYL